jgi:ankyrin repeat protein
MSGDVQALDRLITRGLTAAVVRAGGNQALRTACGAGHLDVVERLLAFGLTLDDVRARDNLALRWACEGGHLDVVERLLSLGLTADDARAVDNESLRNACARGYLAVVERLLSLGLTIADARARNNEALAHVCYYDSAETVCTLAAAGVIEPTGDLQVKTLKQILRAPTMTGPDDPEVARRAETRRAAARAAAEWPGHAEALAQLSPKAATAWEELYAEATLAGYGALRFAGTTRYGRPARSAPPRAVDRLRARGCSPSREPDP